MSRCLCKSDPSSVIVCWAVEVAEEGAAGDAPRRTVWSCRGHGLVRTLEAAVAEMATEGLVGAGNDASRDLLHRGVCILDGPRAEGRIARLTLTLTINDSHFPPASVYVEPAGLAYGVWATGHRVPCVYDDELQAARALHEAAAASQTICTIGDQTDQ